MNEIKDGISANVYYLSKALKKNKCELWVLGLNPTVEKISCIESEGIQYVNLPCRYNSLYRKMLKLMSYSGNFLQDMEKKYNIDVFHGHGGYVGPIAKTEFLKSKKIMTLHTTYEEDDYVVNDLKSQGLYVKSYLHQLKYPKYFLKKWRSWYFHKMDGVISVTKHNVDVTSGAYGLPSDLYDVIYNGVDINELKKYVEYSSEPRRNIIYFGRLDARKGVHILITAMATVVRKNPDVTLDIVGDGRYREYLMKLAKKLGLSKNTVFHGFLDRKSLLQKLCESGIVVIPSLYEGIPVTLFESGALRKPIVVSALPGVKEILTDYNDCLMFTPGSIEELTHAISLLLSDECLCRKLGKNLRELVEKNYSWETAAVKTLGVYKKRVML